MTKPKLRCPDGVPDGWIVSVADDGVPELRKRHRGWTRTPGPWTLPRMRVRSRTYVGEWFVPQEGERIALRSDEALEWEEV